MQIQREGFARRKLLAVIADGLEANDINNYLCLNYLQVVVKD